MIINGSMRIRVIVHKYPETVRVFQAHGITCFG
jgi:hypothetical protein